VGATYAPGQDRKTLLRASYSRFANQLGSEIYNANAFPGPASLYYYWTDANGNHRVVPDEVDTSPSNLATWNYVNPLDTASTASVNRISPNLKAPVTDEFIVGAQRQIFSDLSASVAYTHRAARNLEFPWFPFNPGGPQPIVGVTRSDYQHAGNASGTATADGFSLSFDEPYYALATCPDPCAGVVIENRPDYSMNYNGVELQVVKRLSHGWSLRVGAAYNDWTQTVGSGAIVNPNNLRTGTNASGPVVEVAGRVGNTGAGSFVNSKWQFNASGTVLLPLEILAAANFFGRQGFPTIYFARVSVTDKQKRHAVQLQIGDVGAYRNPDVYQLDFHLERAFRIGSRVSVTPAFDCFNVADSHTVLQRVGLVGTYDATRGTPFRQAATFNQPVERLSDRTFRLGARIAF
jgi:hypothetical protein